MAYTPLTLVEANTLIQPLVGLAVSLPWKGYGSAIFLELGSLAPLTHPRQHHNEGEACITLEWDWRVEEEATVLFGSSNSGPDIECGIERLCGESITKLLIHGQVPELLIQFSNGQRLVSAAMATGDPQWSIRFGEGKWVSCERGAVIVGDGSGTKMTEEEDKIFEHADITAKRWGIPVTEPHTGMCSNCNWFERIDGNGMLLDYGVCSCASSPMDGRAVNVASGCGSFSPSAI